MAKQYITEEESLVTVAREPLNELEGKIVSDIRTVDWNSNAGGDGGEGSDPLQRLGDCENRV